MKLRSHVLVASWAGMLWFPLAAEPVGRTFDGAALPSTPLALGETTPAELLSQHQQRSPWNPDRFPLPTSAPALEPHTPPTKSGAFIMTPNPSIDYKMRIVEPSNELDYKLSIVGPAGFEANKP